MTDKEWLNCTTAPTKMFRKSYREISPRKMQLLAASFCRMVPGMYMPASGLEAIRASERFADEDLPAGEYGKIMAKIQLEYDRSQDRSVSLPDPVWEMVYLACATANFFQSIPRLMTVIQQFSGSVKDQMPRRGLLTRYLCDAIREVTAFPFRTYKRIMIPGRESKLGFTCPMSGFYFPNKDVCDIAQQIHCNQDFQRLPILADALEDAGFADERMLAHFRNGKPHLRGCWALDLILGKS